MKTIKKIKSFVLSINNPIQHNQKAYRKILSEVIDYHSQLRKNTDNELQSLSRKLYKTVQKGNAIYLDDILIPAYALVKEVCIRKLNITPFDVQILGAIGLQNGNLIEMQTGEGKTLTAVFPAYLNALFKRGVHILTFNDYLAKRDAAWMLPIYKFLGLSVGYISEDMDKSERKKSYGCDITYATAKEVGFDCLRSEVAYDKEELVMRPFNFAIVDEADAILIDEARNPLVLAGNIIKTNLDFYHISRFAHTLNFETDFLTDEYSRNVFLTEEGVNKAEKKFKVENLLTDKNIELYSAINLALQARWLLKKDIDYIVKNKEVKLIDEFTGRIVEDRKWRNGLQTSVEAKEKMEIKREGTILNSITLPNLLQQYPKKAAMTATAIKSSEEFEYFYRFKTIVIPPNKPCKRTDFQDLIFDSKEEKNRAILKEVSKVHKTGQPLLVGTLTVKESEVLASDIRNMGIPCKVLNAKNDEQESKIIQKAGMLNAVTISTNMAGRGTDIILGGPAKEEIDKIIKLGGLYVIGTNRHESSRVDWQLRGRAGRQGDLGMSRFYISLEDNLMVKYNISGSLPKKYKAITKKENKEKRGRECIDHIQRVIEGQMFDLRRSLHNYSELVEKQKTILKNERLRILTDGIEHVINRLQTNLRNIVLSESDLKKIQELFLFQYDKHWAMHLDYLSELREGIHLLRIGGQNPLREFQKRADVNFKSLLTNIDFEVKIKIKYLIENPSTKLSDIGVTKPSSTWTYIVNDFPFSNQLGYMLMDSSNIGLQADILSLIILAVYNTFRKKVKKITT